MQKQDLYRSLFEMCKLLLSEDEPESTAETLLRRVLEASEAGRGFLVVRDARGSFSRSFDVRYDWAASSMDIPEDLLRRWLRENGRLPR